MKKLLLILLCLPFIGFGQNVYIPDANFKALLVGNTAINTNGDAEIQVGEAASFNDSIDCSNMNIYDLTGIEAFANLTYLDCSLNDLSNINITSNLALTSLNTSFNLLTSLNLTNNLLLIELDCRGNQIPTLNISNHTALTILDCSYNQLTNIDISSNSNIIVFICNSNQQLISLDVKNSNNTNMTYVAMSQNPNLSCINVDDTTWSNLNWTISNGSIDPQHYFSINCSGTTSTKEHNTNKELLKVTDLLGRETKKTNQPLFYIYDDGTVEKRIVIE